MAAGSEKTPKRRITPTDRIAIALIAIWLVGAAVFFLAMPAPESKDPLRGVVVMLAIFMPIALIWVAAALARASHAMRDESRRLHAAIDGMRDVVLADRRERAIESGAKPEVEQTLKEIAQSARKTETTLATFASTRVVPRAAPAIPAPERAEDNQPALELGTRAEDTAPPVNNGDLIRALHFPESAEDTEGFAALRRALTHRGPAKLIQASQDVLTLLSQDGIYMDDLRPDVARPEFWRRFASGERGRAVAALGGVRDRSCLALTAGRMREDAIFRDAAHHFLRMFDREFERFEKTATDEEIVALSSTRTARAFMLLGRVTGAFD